MAPNERREWAQTVVVVALSTWTLFLIVASVHFVLKFW